jgi:hexosaminidase
VDATNYLQWIHPRSNAVAERLWSFAQIGKATTDSDAFSDAVFKRLSEHRCRLVDRGIPAAPLGPGFCAQTYV